MVQIEEVLKKVKKKLVEYQEHKNEEKIKVDKAKKLESQYETVLDEEGEIEDWYHDVGARGGFKS